MPLGLLGKPIGMDGIPLAPVSDVGTIGTIGTIGAVLTPADIGAALAATGATADAIAGAPDPPPPPRRWSAAIGLAPIGTLPEERALGGTCAPFAGVSASSKSFSERSAPMSKRTATIASRLTSAG